MSRMAAEATWFPDDKIDADRVRQCSSLMMQLARTMGFTREEYAAAVAQSAEAMTGLPPGADLDDDMQRFLADRFWAVATALRESAN